MTGDVISESFKNFLKRHNLPCLTKPFSIDDLRSVLSDLFASPPSN